jgi:hypothetical protein
MFAMRGSLYVASLLLAAGCWLAAGPGGLAIYASLVCRQQQMHHHHHHGAPTGPCVCDQMGGGSDLAISETLPAPVPSGAVWSAPTLVVDPSVSVVPVPSISPTPPTPPPNAALVV